MLYYYRLYFYYVLQSLYQAAVKNFGYLPECYLGGQICERHCLSEDGPILSMHHKGIREVFLCLSR